MPTFTPNINLKKPLQTESYNVDDFNGNCDLIDTKIGIMTAHKTDNSWKPSLQYLVGDVIYSSRTSDSYKMMECLASGTTGTSEPTWPVTGQTIIDGTVTWGVRDLRVGTVQFDNSTKLATTSFVQRAIGNMAGNSVKTASAVLTATDTGKTISFNAASATTCTLPLSSSLVAGASFWVLNAGQNTVTVQVSAGDSLYSIGNATPTTIILGAGDSSLVTYMGGTTWYCYSGTGSFKTAAAFGSLLSANGYQKLPSGLILQWGSVTSTGSGQTITWTYPAAFTTACYGVFSTPSVIGSTVYSAITNAAPGLMSANFVTNEPNACIAYVFAIGK